VSRPAPDRIGAAPSSDREHSMSALSKAVLIAVLGASLSACESTTVKGPGGAEFTATTPKSVTVRRGSSTPLEIAIERRNVSGDLKVSITQLPSGVDADRSSMSVATTGATIVLRARSDAALVRDQAVLVTVEDSNGRQAKQYVNLTVTE